MRVGDELAGRYRLEQRLGKGGFGEVWRAHDTALDRAVAVKVLLETAMADEAVARFRREATIGARLQHPGITVVHDVGQEEGRLFIVMELLAGEDLRSTLSRVPGGLPVPVALELAAQAAEALAAAHERSVIHRDLKPANLFLMPSGRVKICDFGIAHSSDATAGWTVTGRIFGSPPYMAPEQWRGERVDARCDLYALGCVLYALLSGEPPFGEGEVPYVLMRRHIEDLPRSLREAGAVVPPEVERLVRQLLEKDPAARPRSAQAVAAALRALPGESLSGGGAQGGGTLAGGGARDGSLPGDAPRGADGDGTEVGARDGDGFGGIRDADGGIRDGDGDTRGGASEVWGGGGEESGREESGREESGREESGREGVAEVPAGVRAFVRELLVEAEVGLRGLEPGDEARIDVLTVAADAAARFDAELAGRLLGDAEIAAWEGGRGDGARVARLLTRLARATSTRAPARARRLLTDAQQALFTVFGSDREGPLCEVAEELAVVAPGQAARIAADHFADARTDKRLRARVATAVAAADPAEAELQLALIPDAGQRGAATYDMVVAVAPHDVAAALRLSERIGSAGGRLLALCQVARERFAAGDPAGGARAVEQAEEELPRFLEERAAWLREEAAQHAGEGRSDRAERLRKQADALLGGGPGEAADAKADHALASLATARSYRDQDARPPMDAAAAREWADRARSRPDPAQRSLQLALGARLSVGTGRVPWLAEAAADAGSPPPAGIRALGGPDTGAGSRLPGPGPKRRTEPGDRAWHTDARPDAAYAAGAHVVWRSGAEVGCVRAEDGATRWTARSDEGVGPTAPALPGTGPLLVACAADAATVYVEVRREGAPGVRLLAREPRDGRVRWWRDLPGTEPASGAAGSHLPGPRPLRAVGPVLVHGAPGDLTALRAATGEVLWQRPVPDPATRSPAAVGDCLVLADDLRLRALHLPTGRPVWSFQRSRPTARTLHDPRLSGSGLVHLLDEGTLLALDQGSGREVWRSAQGDPPESLLVAHGTVYAASHAPVGRDGRESRDGHDTVHAFDAATGALRWLRQVARCGGAGCGFELLGLRPGGLYVKVPQGGRHGLIGRSSDPYVAVLSPASGRSRRHWDHPPLATADVLLVGDHLVLSRPELTAYGLA
ncbi:serine/threonine-protein kinase [Streptomyces sp. NBC_00193]|uniref:serine/threonine-protein kinase n=1 Tax=Streptomyces sp. NBC_00193 TaxID=2975675 RepID=UPI00224F02E8|nr:serine/threonine-protein kinase [Streptomyces sp. NBC_00193]MCX5296059.1 serine/threonine-protein kinase [Streptomyces sp. NBC_00193]